MNKPIKCQSCQAPIVWLKTRAGKLVPVNAGTVQPDQDPVFNPGQGHISHFATCPDADRHRRR